MRSFEFARKIVGTDTEGNPTYAKEKDGRYELAYKDAKLPEYQTKLAAGADFFCAEEITVPSLWKLVAKKLICGITGRRTGIIEVDTSDDGKKFAPTLVHTGIKASMYDDEVLELYNRSSNPKRGLVLANSVGVIDADYYNNKSNDGEIMFAFYNFMPFDVTIKVGDRIGQGVFKKFLRPEVGLKIKGVDRTGGHGSTNKN